MKLKYALKFMFFLFCIVNTFQVLFIGVFNILIGYDVMMTAPDMLKIPLVSFASVLPTLIFVRGKTKKPQTRAKMIVVPLLHFCLTAGIVFGLLIYLEFMDATNTVILIAFFIAIYVPAYLFQEIRDRKLARQLNKRLIAFHNTENATHNDEH